MAVCGSTAACALRIRAETACAMRSCPLVKCSASPGGSCISGSILYPRSATASPLSAEVSALPSRTGKGVLCLSWKCPVGDSQGRSPVEMSSGCFQPGCLDYKRCLVPRKRRGLSRRPAPPPRASKGRQRKVFILRHAWNAHHGSGVRTVRRAYPGRSSLLITATEKPACAR